MSSLNPIVKALWVNALRSGDLATKYCKGAEWSPDKVYLRFRGGEGMYYPPATLLDWTGALPHKACSNGTVDVYLDVPIEQIRRDFAWAKHITERSSCSITLGNLNDIYNLTFDQIADLIEKCL